MEVVLVVRVINTDKEIIGGYVFELDLPFVPTVGMKFKKGNSTWLWETKYGELSPGIEEVVYNIDEEKIYCLFEIKYFLVNSIWKEISQQSLNNSFELMQFSIHE